MTTAELRKLKTATKKLSKWESSGKAFGHYTVIETKATNTDGVDRIYEFYCLLRILDDLRNHYNIKLVPGTKSGKIFPQAPAPKKGWSYFEIENKSDKKNKYQICYGTNIKLSKAIKTTIAPDISVQKHDATDDPDESMVELIVDAKFKYNADDSLPIDQLHSFMQRVEALQTKSATAITLNFNTLSSLKANCLLTNGKGLSNQLDYCKLYQIKQVERFDIRSSHNVIG